MSWYRRIKSLFTIEFIIFFYIIWSTINLIVTKKHVSSLFFLNLLIVVFLMQYINYKKDNKVLAIGISVLAAIPINYIMYKTIAPFLLNYIYTFFIVIYCYKLDKMYIDYDFSREIFKKSLLAVIILWFITMFYGNTNGKSFFRFYIIYFTGGIIYLRQIRNYNYNVISKKSIIVDGITTAFIFSLCIEKFYNLFFKGLIWLKNGFNYIMDIFITILARVLDKPYTAILIFLRRLFQGKKLPSIAFKKKIKNKRKIEILNYKYRDIAWISILIKIILIIIILIIIYKIIQKILCLSPNQQNASVISEETEKIRIYKKEKKKGFFRRMLDNIYLGKDPRKKIRYFYRTLEREAKDKQLFDEYMTANQFENSIKINRDVKNDDLCYITKKYNEVKFSIHEIDGDEVEDFKNKYLKVKKKI